jgi:hypothetical protein
MKQPPPCYAICFMRLLATFIFGCGLMLCSCNREELERKEAVRQIVVGQKAEYNRLRERLHDMRLDAYERQFGHTERLRLEAFEFGVRADGVEKTCRKQSGDTSRTISPQRCEALEKNRQALYADGDAKFTRPSAH